MTAATNVTGRQYLWRHLYGVNRGYLCVVRGRRSGNRLADVREEYFAYPAGAKQADAWVEQQVEQGYETYQCAHLLTRKERVKSAASLVSTLWTDGDEATMPDDLPASALLRTSQGREQHFLQLTRAIEPERAEQLNRRLAAYIGADGSGYDRTQLLRVPDTRNFKYPGAPFVTLAYVDDALSYDPDELDRILPPLPTRPELAEPIGETIPDGKRNDTLASMAGSMRRRGMDAEEIEAALIVVNDRRCKPPLDTDELRTIARSVSRYAPEPPEPSFSFTQNGNGSHEPKQTRTFPQTDTGNAERLVHRYGQEIRFNWGKDAWHVWSGKHWQLDTSGRMEQLAKATVRAMLDEAKGLEGEHYTKLLKWSASSESAGKRAAMVELARSEDGIPVQPRDLDANPWLLNVSNGTLDLTTGTLRPHNRTDLITRLIDTPYDASATCPTFLGFLTYIFNGNQALIDYVQRMVGYSLTGSIREQIVLIAYGQGSNGKSTLLGILRRLFGDYACEADAESFMEKKSDAIREDIAALEGARFVAASETGDSKRLSEALVKKLTGGEHLRARRLYENGYEFLPQFKVWLSTNHKPEIHGTEHAIWRRIRLIPFDVTIPEGSRDKDFPAKLEAELPGILAWAVRGCLDWQQDGEQPPESVTDATSAYRREMDIIGNWLDDRCELRPGVRETPKALYDDYVSYCETTGETPIKQRTFGMKLTARGCGEEKSNNVRYRTGIRLSDPDHHEQATFETGTQGTQGTDVSGNFPSNASTRDLPESYVPYVPCVPVKNAASDEFVEVEI